MNKVFICPSNIKSKSEISITGSKSESNRLIIINALYSNIKLLNLSNSLSSKSSTIDIGHAGTAMRFLTSYFSLTTRKDIELRGSQRMHNRPIKILVDLFVKLEPQFNI